MARHMRVRRSSSASAVLRVRWHMQGILYGRSRRRTTLKPADVRSNETTNARVHCSSVLSAIACAVTLSSPLGCRKMHCPIKVMEMAPWCFCSRISSFNTTNASWTAAVGKRFGSFSARLRGEDRRPLRERQMVPKTIASNVARVATNQRLFGVGPKPMAIRLLFLI